MNNFFDGGGKGDNGEWGGGDFVYQFVIIIIS